MSFIVILYIVMIVGATGWSVEFWKTKKMKYDDDNDDDGDDDDDDDLTLSLWKVVPDCVVCTDGGAPAPAVALALSVGENREINKWIN